MSLLQVNVPGMLTTDPGYISSITIRTAGAAAVLVPDATSGQVTVDSPAITHLTQDERKFKLIQG